jgi:hypothetical protein
LEIERQIDDLKENTPHDLLQTLMTLYSDAIEYYGANDDHEMCIDLNMRMQSVLVRPYILDCLCEHNKVSGSEKETFNQKMGGEESKTNFENDNRRSFNPFKYNEKKKKKVQTPKHKELQEIKKKLTPEKPKEIIRKNEFPLPQNLN